MLLSDFQALTGVNTDYLSAAGAGDLCRGSNLVILEHGPTHAACQQLALAACIPLARMAGFLAMDLAVREAAQAAVVDDADETKPAPDALAKPTDDAGCVVPVPLGVLREAARVLDFARTVFGVPPCRT